MSEKVPNDCWEFFFLYLGELNSGVLRHIAKASIGDFLQDGHLGSLETPSPARSYVWWLQSDNIKDTIHFMGDSF